MIALLLIPAILYAGTVTVPILQMRNPTCREVKRQAHVMEPALTGAGTPAGLSPPQHMLSNTGLHWTIPQAQLAAPLSCSRWMDMEAKVQQAVTLSLLAQLPVVLPELQDELGAEQLHLGVWGQHF